MFQVPIFNIKPIILIEIFHIHIFNTKLCTFRLLTKRTKMQYGSFPCFQTCLSRTTHTAHSVVILRTCLNYLMQRKMCHNKMRWRERSRKSNNNVKTSEKLKLIFLLNWSENAFNCRNILMSVSWFFRMMWMELFRWCKDCELKSVFSGSQIKSGDSQVLTSCSLLLFAFSTPLLHWRQFRV